MSERNYYPTLQQAIDGYVVPSLGDYADEYDLVGIASEVFDYFPCYGFRINCGLDAYWDCVRRHDYFVLGGC